jgi:hypothetical protein
MAPVTGSLAKKAPADAYSIVNDGTKG